VEACEYHRDEVLSVRTSTVAGAVLVTVEGEVDVATAPELQAHLNQAASAVLVDLNAVSFIGSHGLAALVEAHSEAKARGSALCVVLDGNGIVRRSLEITGLAQVLAIHRTAAEALAALGETDVRG
jgi:anti-sigma B factor antagonist